MGQFQGQPWLHSEIFPQAESCQGHSTEFSFVDRQLSCADAISWSGVLGLRPFRRPVHRKSLRNDRIKDVVGGVVQPIQRSGGLSRSGSRWLILPIQSAFQRRCRALPGGYRGTRDSLISARRDAIVHCPQDDAERSCAWIGMAENTVPQPAGPSHAAQHVRGALSGFLRG